jgi:hypothetical protein
MLASTSPLASDAHVVDALSEEEGELFKRMTQLLVLSIQKFAMLLQRLTKVNCLNAWKQPQVLLLSIQNCTMAMYRLRRGFPILKTIVAGSLVRKGGK